jgi:adenosylcobyric acid synthase
VAGSAVVAGGAVLVRGALLVAGASSDAGKSLLTAGLCRWLARAGVRVAPFKAQNMSNNSAVTPDGGEIGRAQALQAEACGLEPDVRFNPVLLKPGSDRRSHLILRGQPAGEVSARSYAAEKPQLLRIVVETLAELRRDYDVVICEGAGSPAEINLRATDVANMGLARAAGLPTLVVGDIDRGGVFAALYGTLALLSPNDQALIGGFVINKFRGDPALLAPGLDRLRELTGRPVLGTLPWVPDVWIDAEDSLSYGAGGVIGRGAPPVGTDWLRVAVVRLPRMSNVTDVDALAAEPGVRVQLVRTPAELLGADLVVVPGTRATVSDLAWLRATGLADAVLAHHAAGRPVLGICGGYQMFGLSITDSVEESESVQVDGLGLAPVRFRFDEAKTLARPTGRTAEGIPLTGYEIHHGRVEWRAPGTPSWFETADGASEGVRLVAARRPGANPIWTGGTGDGSAGAVFGTLWHGTLENDAFRRGFLADLARFTGRRGFTVAPDTDYRALRSGVLDRLADLVEEHLDTAALRRLIESGPPAGMPVLPPGAPDVPPPVAFVPGGPEWSDETS